jgi:hypothetical protein
MGLRFTLQGWVRSVLPCQGSPSLKKKKKNLLARKEFVDEMIASRVVFVLLGNENNKG